jgi:hypothetical protein
MEPSSPPLGPVPPRGPGTGVGGLGTATGLDKAPGASPPPRPGVLTGAGLTIFWIRLKAPILQKASEISPLYLKSRICRHPL